MCLMNYQEWDKGAKISQTYLSTDFHVFVCWFDGRNIDLFLVFQIYIWGILQISLWRKLVKLKEVL